MKHDSPSIGETVGFDLDDGTDHREGHARFRSWTRFSWETSVFNGSLSDDVSPIGSKSGAKGWVHCPRRVSVVRYGRRVRVPAVLAMNWWIGEDANRNGHTGRWALENTSPQLRAPQLAPVKEPMFRHQWGMG